MGKDNVPCVPELGDTFVIVPLEKFVPEPVIVIGKDNVPCVPELGDTCVIVLLKAKELAIKQTVNESIIRSI
jgi:hypothetical protein